jgi:hypoxia up-regulated 1
VVQVRSYGSESFNSYGKRPASALWQARNLLGQAPAHLSAAHLRAHLIDYHDISVADDGTGAIRIEFAKGTKDARTFMPEKVVAMILGHARDMGERHGNTKVSSVVITVPSFFTQSQRQAIMDAAEIAGLQVLALADENAAAAVQYAVDRTFTEDAKNVLFFNMGSGSTQVSVVSFTGGKERLSQKDQRFVRVLSKAWDHTLGASEFDVKLMDFFADDFDKVHPGKESIRTAPRAMVRLKKEGRAVKEILSGLDKFPVSFQSLYRDVDYKQVVTRALFEELSAPLLARIRAPIERALLDAGVLASSLSGIEIVGGGVRIPCVKTEMRKALPGDLEFSTHLNGDEGMALGAAFIGANVSKTFRVPRVVVLQDANPREVRLQLAGESGTGEKLQRDTVLFPRLAPVDAREPTTHTVKFAWKADFAVTLSAVDDGVVAAYQVSWLDPAAQQLLKPAFGEPKVFLGLSMDRNLMAALDGVRVGLCARADQIRPSLRRPRCAWRRRTKTQCR